MYTTTNKEISQEDSTGKRAKDWRTGKGRGLFYYTHMNFWEIKINLKIKANKTRLEKTVRNAWENHQNKGRCHMETKEQGLKATAANPNRSSAIQ